MKCVWPFKNDETTQGIFYGVGTYSKNFNFKNLTAFTICFFGVIIIESSCKTTNEPVNEDQVYYYPEKNVYYDSLRSNYYYSLDSAKTWDSLFYKGPAYGTVLGQKFSIKRTSNKIWLYNEAHRKAYNGIVLNIVNQHTISLTAADNARKPKKNNTVKARPVVVEKEEAPIRGLKKFFNRLFGKKKKPPEEKEK